MRKLLLDALLFVLFIAELSFHHLPAILHEILGVALTAAIVVHVAINFRRFMSSLKGITPRKFLVAEVDCALALATVIIFLTSLCMSNYLFPDAVSFELRRNMTIHDLHVSTPYIMMILIGMHLGLHWDELRQIMLNKFAPQNFYQRWGKFFRVAIVTLSAVGVVGLFLNRFVDRILMKHIFATPATDLHGILFALLIVGGVIFFALITFLLDKKVFRHQKIFGR